MYTSTSSLYFAPPILAPSPSYLAWIDGAAWWVAGSDLRGDDLVKATDGTWRPARTYPEFAGWFPVPVAPALPAPNPWVTVGKVLLVSAAVVGVSVLTYKVVQAAIDEDFGTGEFPGWFRREFIAQHVARHGCRCPCCGRKVPRDALTVDHIVALANGGRTSRANAAVLCLSCNSAKGARNTALDYVRGRAA